MFRKSLYVVMLAMILLAACAPATQVNPQVSGSTEAVAPTQPEAKPSLASTEGSTLSPENTQAPAATATVETPAEPTSIARAITSEPAGLDPIGTASAGLSVIMPYLYDTLVYRDLDNTYLPYLAEKWEMAPDGKQATFTLRQGVTFHDGTPLDADAVKFTFERIIAQGQKSVLASIAAQIDRIETVDAQTVRFSFKTASSTLLSSLANPYAGIVSPTAAQAEGEGFAQKPVGSGPYMLETWEPGVNITLVKNPNYAWPVPVVENKAAAHVDRLVFKVIPDAAQQLAAYQAGELDVLFVNQPSHVAKLKADPETDLHETTLNSLIYLGYNVKKPPFDDIRVRQALSHAVNKEELVKMALGGIGEAAFAPLAPTLPGFDASLKQNELGFDLEKTKSLLNEAGFTQGADGTWAKDGAPLSVTLLTSTRPPNPALATVLQSQFQAAGIQMEILALDSAAVPDTAKEGKFDLLLWRYDWNDADVLRVYLSSARIGSTNRTFYSNPEVDDLLNKAAAEMDDAARSALYLKAQQIILQDAAWQPLYTPKDFIAIRKDASGVVLGPMGRLLMNDAVKK